MNFINKNNILYKLSNLRLSYNSLFMKNCTNNFNRNYMASRYEDIEKLREGYGNRNIEENDLSKEIMDRIKDRRRQYPTIDELDNSELYSTKRQEEISINKKDHMIINGRKVSLSIPKEQVEIVSLKDY